MSDQPEVQEEIAEEPESRSGSRIVVWLFALGVAALFLPLYLVSITINDATPPLQAEFESLQATLTAPPEIPAEEVTLTNRLLDLRAQLAAIQDVPATLIAGHTDWPAIMAAIHSYDANRIRLTGFVHANDLLTLQGNSVEESAVLEFADTLEETGLFSRVSVQTISLSPQPTPTPAVTPAAGETPLAELNMPFVFTLSVDLMSVANGPE